jgi:hypothetical protein
LTVISSYGSPLETGHEAKGRYNLSKLFDEFELENQFAYYLDKRKKKKFNPPFTPTPGGLHPTTTSDQQLSSPHGRKTKLVPQSPPTTHLRRPPQQGSPAPPAPEQ